MLENNTAIFNFIKKNLLEPSEVSKNPFFLFKCDNFLPNKFYKELQSEYPEESFFKILNKNSKKMFFNNEDSNFEDFILKNKAWSKLYDIFNSKEFLNLLNNIYNINYTFEKNRHPNKKWFNFNHYNKFIKKIFSIRVISFFLKKITSFFYTTVEIRFEFSKMLNGSEIFPHTDSPAKLFSLIFYIPESNYKIDNKVGSTIFWRADNKNELNKNWQNKKISENKDIEQFNLFYNEFEPYFEALYSHNIFLGFCKTSQSWHSVKKLNSKNKFVRNSINIFIRQKY